MPPRLDLFTNRLRANSFGGAARSYDTYRPRYPEQMIDDLLALGPRRVLDVGAGTGIASQQLTERGVEVLAVEPDARMAAVAQEKGIATEIDTFEQWDPAGRRFDLVVFAASFHWVDPAVALQKVREILRNGGSLALLWNRLIPTSPTRDDFAAIYRDYMVADTRPVDGNPEDLLAVLAAAGYTVTPHHYPSRIHYSPHEWLDMVFTHSNHLTLTPDKATELRTKLSDRIGSNGVAVDRNALMVLAATS